ncbi:MAG: nucleotidyltransferase [Acidobacteria bacterium]|nr:nucleotidyltransferase [Acidobacteriota bacterium]MCA1642368.1 nucleotidyltransferase [Acidobacteriota bacterium]
MIKVEPTLRLLTQHQVEFVIVGGVAISAHGSSYLTYDLDVAYARTRDNFQRLAEALAPYHPRPRDFPADLPFVWDGQTIKQGTNFTLTTDLGNIDLLGEVSGLGDFDQVRAQSVVMTLFDMQCRVLSLDALIASKRAAGRTKDLLVLPELEALREVLKKIE